MVSSEFILIHVKQSGPKQTNKMDVSEVRFNSEPIWS